MSEFNTGATPPTQTPRRGAWRRLRLAGKPRLTKANLLAAGLALTLGFAIAAQVRQTSIQGLENLREDELVRLLDTVNQDGDRLSEEIRRLEISRDLLESSTTSNEEARRAALERLNALAVLTGSLPAHGPGIVLTITDPKAQVTAVLMLDAVQELRDAGAEAIQIGSVRVVANTWFAQGERSLSVSGTVLTPPYVVTAIGDANNLSTALQIPGGVTESVRRVGGTAEIEISDDLGVVALPSLSRPQYARPVPSPTTS